MNEFYMPDTGRTSLSIMIQSISRIRCFWKFPTSLMGSRSLILKNACELWLISNFFRLMYHLHLTLSVSSLVLLLTNESSKPFSEVIKGQIKEIRKQLDKVNSVSGLYRINPPSVDSSPSVPPKPDVWAMARSRMALAAASAGFPLGPTYTY